MGLSAAGRLVDAGVVGAGQVRLSRVHAHSRERVAARLPGARALEDNALAVAGADVVILAVKPAQFATVASELRASGGGIGKEAIVVSLMAGVDMAALAGGLGTSSIVRASTNIGIDAGFGTTFWIVSSGVREPGKETVRKILAAWGDEVECDAEGLLDIAMVGVGSGPAIVIEFIQGLVQGLVTEGMPRAMAEKGVLSLVKGTAGLAAGGNRSLAEFQQSVVTPGGITAEALLAMDEGRFRATLVHAIRRAHEKTRRLEKPRSLQGRNCP
jgi:pyrroline-5-carboxylate reductase